MDKTTQSAAANAEEGAAAAEELSSQAVHMNGVVGDLTALVRGRRAAAAGASRAAEVAPVHPARVPAGLGAESFNEFRKAA
jgi:methyl-accepting chemotaxis protein